MPALKKKDLYIKGLKIDWGYLLKLIQIAITKERFTFYR